MVLGGEVVERQQPFEVVCDLRRRLRPLRELDGPSKFLRQETLEKPETHPTIAERPSRWKGFWTTGMFHRYWMNHVNQVGGRDGAALATYLDWLDKLQLPPTEIAPLIEASLDQANSAWQARDVLAYLQRYIDADPDGALRLLHLCVGWWRLNGNVWIDSDEVNRVLGRLAATRAGYAMFSEVLDGFAELRVISATEAERYLRGDAA